jgi:hypothetical protein
LRLRPPILPPAGGRIRHNPVMIRGDLSNRLIHLTSGESLEAAFQKFLKILNARRLIANNGHIKGGFKCVCFSEAPVAILGQMLATKDSRYQPLGVMVDKAWLFGKGGRPVIYQSDAEYDDLPESLKYRHVRYEPADSPDKGVDWTWEREWRIREDVILRPDHVTLVVPTRDFPDFSKELHLGFPNEPDAATPGFNSLEWHYVALSDLGVTIEL